MTAQAHSKPITFNTNHCKNFGPFYKNNFNNQN